MSFLLQKNIFIAFLIFLLFLSIAVVVLSYFEVEIAQIAIFLSTALIALPIAYIAIASPINYDLKLRREDENKKQEQNTSLISQYIGNELLINLDQIENIKKSTEKSNSFVKKSHPGTKEELKNRMGIALETSIELGHVLEESSYKSVLASGAMVEIDNNLQEKIARAYGDIKWLRQKSRVQVKLFSVLLDPPPSIVPSGIVDKIIDEKVEPSIKGQEDTIDTTIKSIEEVFPELDKMLKPFGKKFIVEYKKQVQTHSP